MLDQKTLTRIGIAVVVVIAGALFKWLGVSEPDVASTSALTTAEQSAPPIAETTPMPRAAESDAGAAQAPVSGGDFAYYVLVLSWSPTYCAGQHGGGDEEQCRSGRPYGFVLHGLWPQNEQGYPQNCDSSEPRDMSEANMARALKMAPSEDLVRHEWTKHGLCSGLSQDDFITAETLAFQSVHVPPAFVAPTEPLSTTPDDVREAFLAANASLSNESVSATCSRNELAEVWLCLDKSLHPRACSAEVHKRHCGARHVRMLAVRGDSP